MRFEKNMSRHQGLVWAQIEPKLEAKADKLWSLSEMERTGVAAVAEWAHKTLGKEGFIYPVAVQNTASRRIAEGLRGEIVAKRTSPKYESVVYKIPWKG
jgi:Protein of unknown function (DUF4256)